MAVTMVLWRTLLASDIFEVANMKIAELSETVLVRFKNIDASKSRFKDRVTNTGHILWICFFFALLGNTQIHIFQYNNKEVRKINFVSIKTCAKAWSVISGYFPHVESHWLRISVAKRS